MPARDVTLTCNFTKGQKYGLYVDSVQVTTENAKDVLGNGAFTFNEKTKTLYINEDYTTDKGTLISCNYSFKDTLTITPKKSARSFIKDKSNGKPAKEVVFAPVAHTHTLQKHAAKAGSCLENGNTVYWECSDCGQYFKDKDGKIPVAKDSWVIERTGHKLTWNPAKNANCTEDGNWIYFVCTGCGKAFIDSAGTKPTTAESQIRKALGHDYVETVVKPTCKAQGYTLHKCSRCEDYYKDTYTAKTAHKWSDWTTSKAATCTDDGEQTRICTVCKKTQTKTISKLGHDYVETVVKPTCKAQGYTLHKCSRCGDSYKDNYTDTVDHKWSDWKTTKEATETATGTKERICSVCKKTETESIPAKLSLNVGAFCCRLHIINVNFKQKMPLFYL